jgi:hydroxymethylpyrimidine pyrophosphatase-like HAD family hydrolase
VLAWLTTGADVRTLLTHFPPAHFTVVQSQTFCIQLIPPHGHKGNALLRVIDYLNATRTVGSRLIVPERTLVFGDGENDVAMFEVAGMSVAMGNAVDVAKSKARWTTTTNDEGGVGRFLEKVFFPRD